MSAATNVRVLQPTGPRSDKFMRVPIEKITIGARQRSFDPAWAETIAATLPELGLKQPVEVSADGDGFRLIAGCHRLEACRLAGWTEIPARIVMLDDANIDASAALHEAMENLLRNELVALDRMAHLHAAKGAHDALFPNASKAGRPKKVTEEAENNLPVFGRFSFSKEITERVGLSRSLVNTLTMAWDRLSPASRQRLQHSRLADKQGELLALAELEPVAQKLVLDLLLPDPPAAATVGEAIAKVKGETAPNADDRRVTRYAETLGKMPVDQRDRIFEANEEAVRDFARRRGWLS